jgi:hypothetical protein
MKTNKTVFENFGPVLSSGTFLSINMKIIGKKRNAQRYLMSSGTCDCVQDERKIRQKSTTRKTFEKYFKGLFNGII